MPSLNKVQIIGHAGKDPMMRFTPQGTPVTSFSVAVNENSKDKQSTEWFSVQAWNKTAEFVNQYLTKGGLVYVEGRLKTRSWEKDGQKHYKTELIASQVLLLSKGSDSGEATESESAEDHELPF